MTSLMIPLLLITPLALALTILFSRDLNVMVLGEESAAHLGLNVERDKALILSFGRL